MKRVFIAVALLVIMATMVACGSSNPYPVFLGDSYQDVYDYCSENQVEIITQAAWDEDYSFVDGDDYGVTAPLDWFGTGETYMVDFEVERGSDEGVKEIWILMRPHSGTTATLTEDEETEILAVYKALKDTYGDPIGDKNPDILNISVESVEWVADGVDVTLVCLYDGFVVSYKFEEE